MKNGCFIKGLVVLTVLVAVVTYIATNHFDDMIKTPLIKMVLGMTVDEVRSSLSTLEDPANSDTVRAVLENYIQDVFKRKTVSLNELDSVADSLTGILKDNRIGNTEAEAFIQFIGKLTTK